MRISVTVQSHLQITINIATSRTERYPERLAKTSHDLVVDMGPPSKEYSGARGTRTISRSDSMSSRRCFGVHSSKASMHINSRSRDVMVFFSVATISESWRPRPPNSFLAFRKTFRVCSGIPPLLASCLSIAPNIFVVDCSCWEWKSQYSPTTATSSPTA